MVSDQDSTGYATLPGSVKSFGSRSLILGYGNLDRQDDGVAWHILVGLSSRLGGPVPTSPDEPFASNDAGIDFLFTLQLTPEMAETVTLYDRVCFVDAHTGNVPADVNVAQIAPVLQTSPFTHHLTPSTLMALAQALYGKSPQALLVSVRGYEFGFARTLSASSAQLAEQAVNTIETWLSSVG